MPLLDRQKKAKQIGEIRLGLRVATAKGNLRPAKGETLRFTTRSGFVAQDVANKLGGDVHETTLSDGRATFEVITNVTEVAVMVPPGDAVISQHYEMWTAAGCARRCDGFTDQISGGSCKCPNDLDVRKEMAMKTPPQACKPLTRLNVMLPYIADLGVWLVQSTGDMAADELGEIASVLKAARNQGVAIPAMLRMEQRVSRIVGEKPHEYVVPVLDTPQTSLYDLIELSNNGAGLRDALPPPPAYVLDRQVQSSQFVENTPRQITVPKPRQLETPIESTSSVVIDHDEGERTLEELRTSKGLDGLTWRNFATKVLRRNVSDGDEFSAIERGKLFDALNASPSRSEQNESRTVDPETGEITEVASGTELAGGRVSELGELNDPPNTGVSSPGSPPSQIIGQDQVEVLKVVFREHSISGPQRWSTVEKATGVRPKAWEDVTQEQAKAVIDHLDSTEGV